MAGIDAILTGLGRLAGALPEARRMIGDVADVRPMGPRIAALEEMVKKAGSKVANPVSKIVGKRNAKLSEIWDEDVYELDPKKFASTYKVGWPYQEAKTWDDLSELDDYWEGPMIRYDPDDIDASDITRLTEDIGKRGIQTPIRVSKTTGEVLDGHHRVMAARDTGRKVRFVLV